MGKAGNQGAEGQGKGAKGPPMSAEELTHQSYQELTAGKLEEALRSSRRAVEAARRGGSKRAITIALNQRYASQLAAGHFEAAREAIAEAYFAAMESGDA